MDPLTVLLKSSSTTWSMWRGRVGGGVVTHPRGNTPVFSLTYCRDGGAVSSVGGTCGPPNSIVQVFIFNRLQVPLNFLLIFFLILVLTTSFRDSIVSRENESNENEKKNAKKVGFFCVEAS